MELKNILIISPEKDQHSAIVQKALTSKGQKSTVFDASKLATEGSIEFFYKLDECACSIVTNNFKLMLSEIDVVWQRRPYFPVLPNFVAKQDESFAFNELKTSTLSLYEFLEDAFWVNPRASRAVVDLKPYQLKAALRYGLSIPKTTITNSAPDIKRFIQETGKVIYKPLNGHVWHEERKTSTYTASISADEPSLLNEDLIRLTPGIFQEQIDKKYEVRAQFFGATCFAVKIDPNTVELGDLDWRRHQDELQSFIPIALPYDLYKKCRQLMKHFNIVAGGFDFIIKPNGDWIFLEVNEAGQFAFLEQWCPDLPVLDAFCEFLRAGDPDFKYKPSSTRASLTDYQKDLAEVI